MTRSKTLSREEEAALFAAGKSDAVVTAHIPLAKKFAHKYSRGNPTLFEDLLQEGCIGLTIAAARFDPTTGNRFLTYASYWVRSEIMKHLWLTRHLVQQSRAAENTRAMTLMSRGGIESASDLAQKAGISDEVATACFWMFGARDLRTERIDEEGNEYEWLASDSDPEQDVTTAHDHAAVQAAIQKAINLTTDKQQEALRLLYSEDRIASVREVAEALGISHAPAHARIQYGLRSMAKSYELREIWEVA